MRLCKATNLMACKYSSLGSALRLLVMGVEAQSRTDSVGVCRHVDLRGNLVKAMMVMNWLNMLEVEKF